MLILKKIINKVFASIMIEYLLRNIKRIQLIAPDYQYVATMSNVGVLCIYEVISAKLVSTKECYIIHATYIFLLLRSGTKTKRGVEFRRKIRWNVVNRVF